MIFIDREFFNDKYFEIDTDMALLGFFGFSIFFWDFCKKNPVPAVVGMAEIALGD